MEESPYRYQQGKSQISQQDVQGYNNSIHQNNRNINQFNSANINSSLISQNLNNSSQGYGSNYPQSISEQDENWSRYEGEYQSSQPFQPTLDEKYMQPLEKIQSNKWQLRKIGYQEIQQVFTGVHLQLGESDEVQDIPLEQYGPWLKNIISEKNFLALTEGLKAIEIFIDHYQGTLQNQIINYYLGDLIKKAPLFKPQQQQIALNIMNYTLLKGDAPFVAHEVAKQLESSNPKIVQFGLQIIKNALEYQLEIEETIFVDETMRILFHSNLALLKNTNKEIRSTAIENLKLIFIQCKESEKEIEKAFLGGQRSVHLKEIQDIFKKTQKKIMKFKLIQEGKNVENEKINKQVLNKGQKVDLLAVLPEKFFEIPYLLQPIQKKNKLEEMWQNIQKLIEKGVQTFTYKDGKDYSNIFNILVSCLEESNFLIFNEALKCVKNLMKLMRNGIPFPILKNFLTLIIDQFRGPKARQYNQAVWQALDDCFFNQCCSYEQLIDLMIVNCENEKNLNTRVGCINWLGGRFIPVSLEFVKDSIDLLDIDTQILSQKGEKLQKLIDCIDIKIEAISKKALNQILKEACQYLLMRKNNEYFNEYDKENSNTYNIHNLSTNQNQSNSSNNKKNENSKQPQQLSKPPEPTKLDKQIKQPPQKIQAQPQSPVPPQKQQPQQQLKPSPSTEINLLDIGINDYQSEKAPDQRRNNPSPPIVTRKSNYNILLIEMHRFT